MNQMDKSKFENMVALARDAIADRSRAGSLRNLEGIEKGRFVLFHAAMSFFAEGEGFLGSTGSSV